MFKKEKNYKKIFICLTCCIFLIFLLEACTTDCQTNNYTILKVGIDSAGKSKVVNFKLPGADGKSIYRKSDTLLVLLDPTKEVTPTSLEFSYLKRDNKDSVVHKGKVEFGYVPVPFVLGPDCGADIRITDLKINSFEGFDSVKILDNRLQFDRNLNVKIYIH